MSQSRQSRGITLWAVGAVVALAVWVAPQAAAETTAPTPPPVELQAEAILDRWAAAMGGADAFAKIDTAVAEGTIEMVGLGIQGALTIRQARPDHYAIEFEAPALGRVRSGTNGEIAWEVSDLQGPRLVEGSEKEFLLRSSVIDQPVRWRELYPTVELVGTATVDDVTCHELVLTPASGHPETWFVAQSSGLVVKMAVTVTHVMGEIPVEISLSDYRQVDGIMVPFRTMERMLMQQMLTTISNVEHNVELPADAFAPPDEVKALLAKGAAEPVPAGE